MCVWGGGLCRVVNSEQVSLEASAVSGGGGGLTPEGGLTHPAVGPPSGGTDTAAAACRTGSCWLGTRRQCERGGRRLGSRRRHCSHQTGVPHAHVLLGGLGEVKRASSAFIKRTL